MCGRCGQGAGSPIYRGNILAERNSGDALPKETRNAMANRAKDGEELKEGRNGGGKIFWRCWSHAVGRGNWKEPNHEPTLAGGICRTLLVLTN